VKNQNVTKTFRRLNLWWLVSVTSKCFQQSVGTGSSEQNCIVLKSAWWVQKKVGGIQLHRLHA
jgi:hypothetical protein